jgi:16S rRNA (guanine527-N7)-methyltransferase
MTEESPVVDRGSLEEELARHQIVLPADQVALLANYCHWLWDWNEKINLTRHTTFEKFVSRDVVDSMQLAKVIEPDARVIDVGTGGGVPGVILAIVRPDLRVALTDSVAKKARAVSDIVRRIGLKAAVHALPAQELLAEEYYDDLVVRAVAPLAKLLTWFQPYWGSIGRLLIIKGPAWVEERAEARHRNLMNELQLRKLATWPLPGTENESVLLEIRPKEEN